jgi:hypothetical protein
MRTTMDIYSHVMPALAREAADRMGAVLLGDPDGGGPRRTTTTARGLHRLAQALSPGDTSDIPGDLISRQSPPEGTYHRACWWS